MGSLSLGLLYRCGHDKHSHLRPPKNPSSGKELSQNAQTWQEHSGCPGGGCLAIISWSDNDLTSQWSHSLWMSPAHLISMRHRGPAWTVQPQAVRDTQGLWCPHSLLVLSSFMPAGQNSAEVSFNAMCCWVCEPVAQFLVHRAHAKSLYLFRGSKRVIP